MAVRIGIDVGGTFTDAVIVDDHTFELLGSVKIPTTHNHPAGVAAGIVEALERVLAEYHLSGKDVAFIAHGTTQATNALLEGDVERVGIIGVGSGVEGYKVKADTQIEDIALAPNKYLRSDSIFLNSNASPEEIDRAADAFQAKGIQVAVVSSAYSVDDPRDELRVKERLLGRNLMVTCGHDISKLYGLKIRTRTAVINASILPKMMQTAKMTEESVKRANIAAPLMIMRCDGGVMSVQEVKNRPVLTMLSGPAAGVAGALMYEKISEGIFLEVGGTSTDISTIHHGRVMVSNAEVGGHKTYVNSLDIRTVAIAGGSMIRISDRGVLDVGPRSAHIAGLPYIAYTPPEELGELRVVTIRPLPNDFDDYAAIEDVGSGKRYALTLTCAANAAGYTQAGQYASGYAESSKKAFETLARHLSADYDALLRQIHEKAAQKNQKVVNQMIADYQLDPGQVVLVGGGGGAAAVVPFLAEFMGLKHRIARNAEVISPIGVALAMVREEVERTISNPTEADILAIRREAEQLAIKSGAASGTVEVSIEVDPRRSIVRATATGSTELQTGNRGRARLEEQQIQEICADSLGVSPDKAQLQAKTDFFWAYTARKEEKKLFGLFKTVTFPLRVADREGVIRVQFPNAIAMRSSVQECLGVLRDTIGKLTEYTEGGERIPEVFVGLGARVIDLAKLANVDQVCSLLEIELKGQPPEMEVLLVFASKMIR